MVLQRRRPLGQGGQAKVSQASADYVGPILAGVGSLVVGSVDTQHLLDDPDDVIQGDRVLHLRYRVRR